MGILNSSLPNLLSGVSQQADALRSPTHCAQQTNAYPSPVEGLMKRHPTEFMTDDFTSASGTSTLDTSSHAINRDSGEKYLVTVKPTFTDNGELEVWDLLNNSKATVYYDQAVSGEEFTTQGVKAQGMIRVLVPENNDQVTIIDANGYSHIFKYTTGDPTTFPTGSSFSGGTYVNINGVSASSTQARYKAERLKEAINSDSASELKVTAIHLGSQYYNNPFADGDLPTNHPEYDSGSTAENTNMNRNVLLIQDIEGTAGNTDMVTNDATNLTVFNFGENGLTAGVDPVTTSTIIETTPREYLKALDPKTAFKFLTIGDVTFIVNTEREVKMHSELTPKFGAQGLVTIKQAAYNTEYIVEIDGQSNSVTTGNSAGDAKTTTIATNLTTALNGGAANSYHTDTSVPTSDWHSVADSTSRENILKIDVDYGSGTPTGSDTAFTVVGKSVRFTVLPGTVRYWIKNVNWSGNTHWTSHLFNLNTDYYVESSEDIGGGQRKITLKDNQDRLLYYYNKPTGTSQIKGQYKQSTDFSYLEFTTQDSNILVKPLTTGTNFTMSTSDSVGNTYLDAFKDRTQYLTDLPAQCTNGFKIRIDGDVENNIDDYYLEFQTRNNEAYGEGMWVETTGSQIPFRFDYSTMPHILIRQADGSFLFKSANGFINASTTEIPRVTSKSIDGFIHDPSDAMSTGDTQIVVDGLPPHTLIPKYSEIVFDIGTGSQVTKIINQEAESDSTGEVALTLSATVATDYPDNEAVVLNIKSDYSSFKYGARGAGDQITNPDPSFVGQKINNIFFYENRLGFLAGENCVMSETGEFFNFFRTTVIDLLDTAPIDLAVSSNEIATLRHAVPYKNNLILFSDTQQFALGSGRTALSNETVALTQVSYDECNINALPIASGSSLYYGYDRGEFSGMRQMAVLDAQGDNYTSVDIADHVPQYIPNSWKMYASMPQQNLIIGLPEATDGTMQDLYLYKYLDKGNQRVQSAWFKYSLPLIGDSDDQKQIIGIHAIDNILYVLCQWRYVSSGAITGGKTYLYKMKIENNLTDSNSIFVTKLDSRVSYDATDGAGADAVTASYNTPVSSKTTFTLPFTWSGNVIKAYTKATDSDGGAAELTIDTQNGAAGTLVIAADKTGSTIWFGLDYTMTYEFSKPVIRGSAGQGSSQLLSGRFQIMSCDVSFDDSTTFTASVTNPGRANTYTYTHTTSATDVLSTTQGSTAVSSGDFRIPIHTKSDAYTLTITSSSPFPVSFMSAEYEAQYSARSRRMNI